jgi:hypothetical protein
LTLWTPERFHHPFFSFSKNLSITRGEFSEKLSKTTNHEVLFLCRGYLDFVGWYLRVCVFAISLPVEWRSSSNSCVPKAVVNGATLSLGQHSSSDE